MPESVLYINERATEHCAQMTLSNLVVLRGTPDVGRILAQSTTSSNPPSRNQRRINVDRVSIRKGAYRPSATQWHGPSRNGTWKCSGRNHPRPFTNADSYSRCFRYKRLIRQTAGPNKPVLHEPYPRVALPNSLGRFISSQFDRKTDCFDGGVPVHEALMRGNGKHRDNLSFSLLGVHEHDVAPKLRKPGTTFKAVCGTQTKQGGCLYEQPCSQSVLMVVFVSYTPSGATVKRNEAVSRASPLKHSGRNLE